MDAGDDGTSGDRRCRDRLSAPHRRGRRHRIGTRRPSRRRTGRRALLGSARSGMGFLERILSRPAGLFLLVAVLCGGGVWSALRLPSSIFPAVTFPRVKIIADAAEEPAAQMIPAVTRPLEEAVLRVPG